MAEWPYNTARWLKLRAAHLSIEPLCRGCKAMGRLVSANTVDHVHAINEGGPAFPEHDGLASYCTGCHSSKTARGAEAGAVQSSKPRRGCDANGNPLDPAHPWSGKSLRAGGLGAHGDHKNQLVLNRRQNSALSARDASGIARIAGGAGPETFGARSPYRDRSTRSDRGLPCACSRDNRPEAGNGAVCNRPGCRVACCPFPAKNTTRTNGQGGDDGR